MFFLTSGLLSPSPMDTKKVIKFDTDLGVRRGAICARASATPLRGSQVSTGCSMTLPNVSSFGGKI